MYQFLGGEDPRIFNKTEQARLLDKVYRRKPTAEVKFSKAKRFKVQVPAPLMVPELRFVKNKKLWGSYFQGASVKLNETDFNSVMTVACMFNPDLRKSFKQRTTKKQNGLIREAEKALH